MFIAKFHQFADPCFIVSEQKNVYNKFQQQFLLFQFVFATNALLFNKWTFFFVVCMQRLYRAFSHDVTTAMLVPQNKEMAAMLVSQT